MMNSRESVRELIGLEKVNQEAFWMVLAFILDRLHSLRQRPASLAAA